MSDPRKSTEGRSGVPCLGIWFIELLTAAKGGEIITSGTHLQIAVSLTYFGLRMLEFWCQHGTEDRHMSVPWTYNLGSSFSVGGSCFTILVRNTKLKCRCLRVAAH